MIGGFLEDSWIICIIAGNLYNHELFAQLWITHTIVDYLCNFTAILWDSRLMCKHVYMFTFLQNEGFLSDPPHSSLFNKIYIRILQEHQWNFIYINKL